MNNGIFADKNEMICGMKEKELGGHDFGLPHTILELKAELEDSLA